MVVVEDLTSKKCRMLSGESPRRILERKNQSNETLDRGRPKVVKLQARKSNWHGDLLASGIPLN